MAWKYSEKRLAYEWFIYRREQLPLLGDMQGAEMGLEGRAWPRSMGGAFIGTPCGYESGERGAAWRSQKLCLDVPTVNRKSQSIQSWP